MEGWGQPHSRLLHPPVEEPPVTLKRGYMGPRAVCMCREAINLLLLPGFKSRIVQSGATSHQMVLAAVRTAVKVHVVARGSSVV